MSKKQQIKNIWGLAKELDLSKDELYCVLERSANKDSMRQCSTKELNRVVLELGHMIDRRKHRPGMASKEQLWKIKKLAKELGWADNPKRLEGFVRRFYKIEKIEWLTGEQAWRAIESLKKMLEKQGESNDS